MPINIALSREQQQRVANDYAALEHQIEREGLEGIKRQAKEDGRSGLFPTEPNSPIYFASWCEGFQKYAIAEKEREFQESWSEVAF